MKKLIPMYLIISSAMAVVYLFVYSVILIPMPFIQNSSFFDTGFTGASFCLVLGLFFIYMIPANIIVLIIYIVFRAVKKKKNTKE